MNAMEIIERVRAFDAELVLEENRLVIRGQGEPLPEDLTLALKAHRAEVMVALGATSEMAVAACLKEIRPYLPAALRRLSDDNLVILINWAVMHAWNRAVRDIGRPASLEATK